LFLNNILIKSHSQKECFFLVFLLHNHCTKMSSAV